MAGLPSGTVTFLFTDIEGSTALWERDPSAMRAAVDRHFALLQDAITAHGGVLFKTVGDAVHAAFGSAAGAVAAAPGPAGGDFVSHPALMVATVRIMESRERPCLPPEQDC